MHMVILESAHWMSFSGGTNILSGFECALIITNVLLVLVTATYVVLTNRIANKTKEQAEATKEMVKIAREQMEYNLQPFVLIKPTCSSKGIGKKTILSLRFRYANKSSLNIEQLKYELLLDNDIIIKKKIGTLIPDQSDEVVYEYEFESNDSVIEFILYYKNLLTEQIYSSHKWCQWQSKEQSFKEVRNYVNKVDFGNNRKSEKEAWHIYI